MARTETDLLLTGANTVDIILYIREHPGCMKSEIYSNITRNVHTVEKLRDLADRGLLTMDESGNRSFIMLTDRGMVVADALLEIGRQIGDSTLEG